MQYLKLLILSILLCCTTQNSKKNLTNTSSNLRQTTTTTIGDSPDALLVYKDLQEILAAYNDVVESYKITIPSQDLIYYSGSFTGENKKECLVVVPPVVPCLRVPCNALMLYEKTGTGWKYAGWEMPTLLEMGNIDTLDINNDHLLEIGITSSILGSGIYGQAYSLLSLTNLKEKELYSYEALDYSDSRDMTAWKKGDTISTKYQIRFFPMKNYHIALEEHKETRIFSKLVGDSMILEKVEKKRTFDF